MGSPEELQAAVDAMLDHLGSIQCNCCGTNAEAEAVADRFKHLHSPVVVDPRACGHPDLARDGNRWTCKLCGASGDLTA